MATELYAESQQGEITVLRYDHHVVLMGAIAHPRLGDPPIGPTTTRVLSESTIPTIVVRATPNSY